MTQTVTVVDDTPPVMSRVTASPSTLWPPNRDVVDVVVNYEAVDNCAMFETTLSVSSNEPVSVGTGSDWEIVDAHDVRLRAQRSARSGDRIYTITINATDVHGNSSSQVVTVRVPRSMEGGIKVWDGARLRRHVNR